MNNFSSTGAVETADTGTMAGTGLQGQLEQAQHSLVATCLRTAFLCEDKGYPDMALVAYEAILACDATHTLALLGRGAMLMLQGRHEESIADFQEASRLKPDDFLPHAYMAQVYEMQGQEEAANQAWQAAMDLDPVETVYIQEIAHQQQMLAVAVKMLARSDKKFSGICAKTFESDVRFAAQPTTIHYRGKSKKRSARKTSRRA